MRTPTCAVDARPMVHVGLVTMLAKRARTLSVCNRCAGIENFGNTKQSRCLGFEDRDIAM